MHFCAKKHPIQKIFSDPHPGLDTTPPHCSRALKIRKIYHESGRVLFWVLSFKIVTFKSHSSRVTTVKTPRECLHRSCRRRLPKASARHFSRLVIFSETAHVCEYLCSFAILVIVLVCSLFAPFTVVVHNGPRLSLLFVCRPRPS